MLADYLNRKFYLENEGWSNGSTEFRSLISNYIDMTSTVLEIGPGTTSEMSEYIKVNCKSLIGLDIDHRAMDNPWLTECYIYDGVKFPFEADKFKVIIADYVMEHVEFPLEMFSEISRVLMPGGVFIFRTPNTRHYVTAIAKYTPHWFHLKVANWSRGYPDKELEPNLTIYKSNNEKDIKKLCRHSLLELSEIFYVEKQPSYLFFNGLLFLLGVLYERFVNSFNFLRKFRANVFCVVKHSGDNSLL